MFVDSVQLVTIPCTLLAHITLCIPYPISRSLHSLILPPTSAVVATRLVARVLLGRQQPSRASKANRIPAARVTPAK